MNPDSEKITYQDYESLIKKYIFSKKRMIQQKTISDYLRQLLKTLVDNNQVENISTDILLALDYVNKIDILTNKELLERYENDLKNNNCGLRDYYTQLEIKTIKNILQNDEEITN